MPKRESKKNYGGSFFVSYMLDKFYVVCVISNPVRYKSRYTLYRQFAERMSRSGVKLLTVECGFGERNFEVTDPVCEGAWVDSKHHVRLTTYDEIWHKENMLNIGIRHLPKDWKYVCWVDADIMFLRDDWAEETFHQLQHHHIVQMFQTAVDLGPTGES